MRQIGKVIGLFVVILCFVQVASAGILVSSPSISPSGDLVSGETQVSASFVINFVSSGGYTFDSENTLQLSTDLDSATWSYVIIQDDIENPAVTEVGPNVNINGWVLSYPSNRDISMRVNMNGVAPAVSTSEEKVIVQVAELSSMGTVIPGTKVERKAMVLNPSQIDEVIASATIELNNLKGSIESLAASGLDMTTAQQLYAQAESDLQNAKISSDYARAQSYLSSAQDNIAELKSLIEQMSAQKAIDDANAPVEQTDALITYFKENKSMSADPRLSPIITKRELAADLVVDARDLASERKYGEAIHKAGEAKVKAEEALADALSLKEDVDSGLFSGLGNIFSGTAITIIIVIVVIILAVLGFFYLRGRRRWDELG